jgi:hypothetical protein
MADIDGDLVDRMAKKHAVSAAAVEVILAALRRGGGRMAQFSHADFGGMSQWSSGMSMVGDMFNSQLKAKLDGLCSDMAAHLKMTEATDEGSAARNPVSYLSQARSADWWPAGLGKAGSVGAQNDLRYAVFPETCRLVIDDTARYRFTIPATTGSSARPRHRAQPAHSLSQAKMVSSGLPNCGRSRPEDPPGTEPFGEMIMPLPLEAPNLTTFRETKARETQLLRSQQMIGLSDQRLNYAERGHETKGLAIACPNQPREQ